MEKKIHYVYIFAIKYILDQQYIHPEITCTPKFDSKVRN